MEVEGRKFYNTDESLPDWAEEAPLMQGDAAGGLDPMTQRQINIRNDPIANASSILLNSNLPSIDTIIETK